MPQLDLATFPGQLFWLAITFGALYIVLSAIAIPRIRTLLEDRQKRIDSDLDRATALKAEADTAIAAYEKALATSRASAQQTLREAAERIAKDSERRQKELGDKLAEQIKAGDARIAAAKDQALGQLRDIAADIARSAASKLAGLSVDAAQAAQAVDSVREGK